MIIQELLSSPIFCSNTVITPLFARLLSGISTSYLLNQYKRERIMNWESIDIRAAKQILEEILQAEERVLKEPAP